MSRRASKRAMRALGERRADYDRLRADERTAYKRPGSQNPRKNHSRRPRKK